MQYQVELQGGPFGGRRINIGEAPKGELGLPVDGDGRPTSGVPFGLAIYRVSPENSAQYRFDHFEPTERRFQVPVFADGPAASCDRMSKQASQLPSIVRVPLADESTVFELVGDPIGVACYELRPENGEWKYFFLCIDRSADLVSRLTEQANETRALQAVRSYYANPSDDIYSMPPAGDHPQVPVEVGHRRGHVDEKIAGVIARIWRLELETIGSCQDRRKGEPHEGDAYVGFVLPSQSRKFMQILASADIPFANLATTFEVGRVTGQGDIEKHSIGAMNVFFSPDDIRRIEVALDARLDSP